MATTKTTTTASKPADPKKMAAPKTAAEKKPAARKTSTKKTLTANSPFERYKIIEVAAYYIAEKDGFQGNAADYWIAAEKEVNEKLTGK